MVRAGTSTLRSTGYQYLRVIPAAWSVGLRSWSLRTRVTHPATEEMQQGRDTGMKSTIKWYAYRATMFLGTIAAGFLVIDGSRRW